MFSAGRTILVTGSTDGIGKQTAHTLAGQGARVLVHGRNQEKVDQTIAEIIQQQPGADLKGYVADFSALDEVRELAHQINLEEKSLHVLINNAGIYNPDFKQSQDGYELTFAVNQLAPFLLTLLLLDKLKANQPARIITLTSIAHNVRDLNLDNINDPAAYRGWGVYKISKYANILFTYALAQKLEGSEVTANCLHPGTVNTKVLHSAFPDMQGISLEDGARTSIYLASSDDVAEMNGQYFEDGKPAQSAPQTYDKALQQAMWEKCEELVSYKMK